MDDTSDLFGQVARRRGFVTGEQLKQAVELQRGRPDGTPKLLGLVMLDEGHISTAQLIEVLREVRAITRGHWMQRGGRVTCVKERAS